jgi:hypothetical protein
MEQLANNSRPARQAPNIETFAALETREMGGARNLFRSRYDDFVVLAQSREIAGVES